MGLIQAPAGLSATAGLDQAWAASTLLGAVAVLLAVLMIAEAGYAIASAGWLSGRCVCYLASGRPVIAQETGLDCPVRAPSTAELGRALDQVLPRHFGSSRRVAALERRPSLSPSSYPIEELDVRLDDGIIAALLPPGLTKLGCHPGTGDRLQAMYWLERAQEIMVLCDPRVRAAIAAAGVRRCSFADVARDKDATGRHLSVHERRPVRLARHA